jgi:hypothetical protein
MVAVDFYLALTPHYQWISMLQGLTANLSGRVWPRSCGLDVGKHDIPTTQAL